MKQHGRSPRHKTIHAPGFRGLCICWRVWKIKLQSRLKPTASLIWRCSLLCKRKSETAHAPGDGTRSLCKTETCHSREGRLATAGLQPERGTAIREADILRKLVHIH